MGLSLGACVRSPFLTSIARSHGLAEGWNSWILIASERFSTFEVTVSPLPLPTTRRIPTISGGWEGERAGSV